MDGIDDKVHAIWKRIEEAEGLLKSTENLQNCGIPLSGSIKLANRIRSEIRFLKKLYTGKLEVKQSHLTSSNLTSLQSILTVVHDSGCEHITSLLQPFKDDFGHSICVDIVANQGHLWIKVIARSATALQTVWKGQGQYGDRSLVDVAKEFLGMAQNHPVDYTIPKIVFHFTNGVPNGLAKELVGLGALVVGKIESVVDSDDSSDEDDALLESSVETASLSSLIKQYSDTETNDSLQSSRGSYAIKKVNLDITTMLSLISNLCNGYNQYVYGLPVLDEQAEQERKSKVLPILKQFLEGKQWIACQLAVEHFQNIVDTIGGPNEKRRADELMSKLTIVPNKPSQRTIDLASSSKLNERAKIIFGTGESERAITVTANSGYVRAALQNGVRYSVFEHEARALTESKESGAKLIQPHTQN